MHPLVEIYIFPSTRLEVSWISLDVVSTSNYGNYGLFPKYNLGIISDISAHESRMQSNDMPRIVEAVER